MKVKRRAWPAMAGSLTAALGVAAALAVASGPAVPAAAAAKVPASPNTYNQGRVVDKTCQERTGGVKTCEWLYEWPHVTLKAYHTTGIEAFASINSKHNQQIREIETYVSRCVNALRSCPGQPEMETNANYAPGGAGYVQGNNGAWYCGGVLSDGFEPMFRYKYFLGKPYNEWVLGNAWGAWQWRTVSCSNLYKE